MNKNKIYLIVLAAVTLIISTILFISAFNKSAKSIARVDLEKEITALSGDTKKIAEENESTEKKISDAEAELSTKNTINDYYMEYKKTHDSLKNEVEELKKQSKKLDEDIAKKQGEADTSANLYEGKKGASYALKKDEAYTCPESVPAGRYKASGSGTFTVISATGKVRLSQNLDVAYDNSYTFNLEEQERIRVTGDVTLTEIN